MLGSIKETYSHYCKDEAGSTTAARNATAWKTEYTPTQRRYFPVCAVKVGGSGKKEVQCTTWVYGAMNGAVNCDQSTEP
jgi:hypothetical protein